jgi:hypothetical protein
MLIPAGLEPTWHKPSQFLVNHLRPKCCWNQLCVPLLHFTWSRSYHSSRVAIRGWGSIKGNGMELISLDTKIIRLFCKLHPVLKPRFIIPCFGVQQTKSVPPTSLDSNALYSYSKSCYQIKFLYFNLSLEPISNFWFLFWCIAIKIAIYFVLLTKFQYGNFVLIQQTQYNYSIEYSLLQNGHQAICRIPILRMNTVHIDHQSLENPILYNGHWYCHYVFTTFSIEYGELSWYKPIYCT